MGRSERVCHEMRWWKIPHTESSNMMIAISFRPQVESHQVLGIGMLWRGNANTGFAFPQNEEAKVNCRSGPGLCEH